MPAITSATRPRIGTAHRTALNQLNRASFAWCMVASSAPRETSLNLGPHRLEERRLCRARVILTQRTVPSRAGPDQGRRANGDHARGRDPPVGGGHPDWLHERRNLGGLGKRAAARVALERCEGPTAAQTYRRLEEAMLRGERRCGVGQSSERRAAARQEGLKEGWASAGEGGSIVSFCNHLRFIWTQVLAVANAIRELSACVGRGRRRVGARYETLDARLCQMEDPRLQPLDATAREAVHWRPIRCGRSFSCRRQAILP